MPLDGKLRHRLERMLRVVDEHDTEGDRLVDDAARLWNRVQRFLKLDLIGNEPDTGALELACYGLQFPMRQLKTLPVGKFGRINLKDRAEQSAELLVSLVGGEVDEALLDRATRLIHEMPQRSPMLDEARLLADAMNLDDFGVTGLMMQMIQLSRQGDGVAQLAEGAEKREQYGYWEARLKDGFHFEPIRQMAKRRLENARTVSTLLIAELGEDQSP
jgi:hypothetical protein